MSSNFEITLQQAVDMTTLYRDNKPANFPLCETFSREAIMKLIELPDCKYIRVYLGMLEDSSGRLIVVGANSDNEDLLPDEEPATTGSGNIIVEDGIRCPPNCPPPSKLNGG